MAVMIQVSELHFSTEDGIKVLEDVHLHIDRGELAFILGPASSGKSVLLALLGGQISLQRGQILVHGRNVARLSRQRTLRLRRRIGFVPQGFVPLPRTVWENVMFKLRALGDFREKAEEKALFALETVGLLREQGADAADLSSLERIRLGLALAICDDPLLLLLDDLFDGLSGEQKEEIGVLIERIHSRGMTILAASRGPLPEMTRDYRILTLADGTVIEA
jgi:cell division transport system ATP-binding protein